MQPRWRAASGAAVALVDGEFMDMDLVLRLERFMALAAEAATV